MAVQLAKTGKYMKVLRALGFLMCIAWVDGWVQAVGAGTGVVDISNLADDLNQMRAIEARNWRIRGVHLGDRGGVSLLIGQEQVFGPAARVILNGGTSTAPLPNTYYFRGSIEGVPGSLAAVSLTEEGDISGLVTDGDMTWELKRASRATSLEAQAVTDNPHYQNKTFSCGQRGLPTLGGTAPRSNTTPLEPADLPVGQFYLATIAVETDFEFYQLFNSTAAATNYIGSLINYVSALYETEIQTRMELGEIFLWTTAADPWVEGEAGCRLYEFGRYWRDNRAGVSRTVAHFLSGADLEGGIAWIDALCQTPATWNVSTGCATLGNTMVSGGFGVSTGLSGTVSTAGGPTWDAMMVAHEIGHNFGSLHTHCYNGIGGEANPVDGCYDWEPGCWAGATGLPGLNSLSGGVSGGRTGTVMSYCGQLPGYLGNIAWTFGLGHPYGIKAYRVPDVMFAGAAAAHAANPACLLLINNSCQSGAITLNTPTVITGTESQASQASITTTTSYQVQVGGNLTFTAPRISLGQGFRVALGGRFHAIPQACTP